MKKDIDKVEVPEKLLIIVRGLPSSGKTTLTKILLAFGGESICSDDYMTMPDGSYQFSRQGFIESHKTCQQDCETLMQKNISPIIIHNNMGEAWEAEKYFELANNYAYSPMVLNLYDAGLNDSELASRSTHSMPQHLIQKVRQKWDIDIFPHRRKNTPNQNTNLHILKRFQH